MHKILKSVHVKDIEDTLNGLPGWEFVQALDTGSNYWHLIIRAKTAPAKREPKSAGKPLEASAKRDR